VLGPIRRILQDIDYHSARRERSVWSRANDAWLITSLPVAIGITALLAWMGGRDEMFPLAHGTLVRNFDRQLIAVFARPGEPIASSGSFVAGIEVRQRVESAGWPFVVWRKEHRPQILVSDGSESRVVVLVGFDEEVSALRRGLWTKEPRIAERALNAATADFNYAALSGSIAVAWIAIIPLGLLGIQALSFGCSLVAATGERRRRSRRARGLCPRCGHATRGIEFAPSCPECGELLT